MWRSTTATANVLDSNGISTMQRSASTHFIAGKNEHARWPNALSTNLHASPQSNDNSIHHNNNKINGSDTKISLHVNYRHQQQQNGRDHYAARDRPRPVSMYEQQQQQQQQQRVAATNNGGTDYALRISPAATLGVGVTRSESLFFGSSKNEQRLQQQQQQKVLSKQRRRQSPSELVCITTTIN